MAKVDFHYIKTGTGELSGPSFVKQTEFAINELGGLMEEVENTAENALDIANKAQTAADNAQTTADTALSQARNAQATADAAQQAADQAQATADDALEAAQNAGDAAGTKAPIMHASAATTYGVGSSTLYGHVQLSDATNGTENAANGGTAATPHAVAQAMTAAQTAQSTANSAQQTAQSAQQAANAAQSTANSAQQTANQTQTALDQAVENFDQQISALSNQNLFTVQDEAISAEPYAGGRYRLYLESTASASTGLPSGISYPCFFWTEAGEDGNTSMMYVLSNNILYSQSGVNTTPDSDTPTWSFTGWQKITYTAATTSALGVVKADGTTVEVAADGTLSINTNLLSQVYKFKGSVATVDDLPTGAAQGDVYNVTATDANYAWTGSAWDNIGGIEAVDSSPVQNSTNPVSSGGVYTALDNLKNNLEGQISTAGAQPSTSTPLAAGTASVGTQTAYARGDHRHPAQTSVSGNAGTATKLATARTIRTNLASTSTASFNGSANVTPGVTGILPVANGGTGTSTGTAPAATKATQDGNGNVITTTYATKAELQALSMPVGSIYFQLSGQAAPADLFGGTWSNVSSTYAGLFFRAEGGAAAPFGGVQSAGLPDLYGAVELGSTTLGVSTQSANGVFYAVGNYSRGYTASSNLESQSNLAFKASAYNTIYGAASEVRPINSTVRIWKRTA